MSQTINNPDIPYISAIDDGLGPGTLIRIQGTANPTGQRFNINLQCGPNVQPRDDIAFHLSVRLSEGYVARNTLDKQIWGDEQNQGQSPIGAGQQFEILILCDQPQYRVAINGQHFCEFPHRIPYHRVTHLAVDGDVTIKLINYELVPTPKTPNMGPDMPPQAAPVPPTPAYGGYGPPQGGQPPYGAPGGQPGYGPPQGHYGPPQGQYGPPQGQYGPPQGQYGPPQGQYGPQGPYGPPHPPGYDPEPEKSSSGLEGFLGQAGAAIAGAFGSAVLQGALSGKQSAPGPQAPQDQGPQQPLQGGYGGSSVGGLGSIGSFLTNTFANSILPQKK